MSRQNDSKGQVFEKEHKILAASKNFMSKNVEEISPQEFKSEYEVLSQSYEQLLGEVKLLTSVSDRLQNKLNRANETVIKKNEELKETNDLLNKNKVGKKATTIILFASAIFFLVSEWLIDPMIEGSVWGYSISFLVKLCLVFALKPLEKILERFLLQTANQAVQDLTT
jgi:hypothetical protein